eukprot:224898_1
MVPCRYHTPLSEDDHGTHVAGTIHFLAPKAELCDYRVFGATGEVGGDEAIAMSIRQAVKDNCQIINMSLRVSYPIVPAVREAVKYAHSKGVVMVCAAGNDGDNNPFTNEMNTFPARWSETISVAAVSKSSGLPVAWFSEGNPEVDFAGIGVDVTSLKPGGGYQNMSGTSMVSNNSLPREYLILEENSGLPSYTFTLFSHLFLTFSRRHLTYVGSSQLS